MPPLGRVTPAGDVLAIGKRCEVMGDSKGDRNGARTKREVDNDKDRNALLQKAAEIGHVRRRLVLAGDRGPDGVHGRPR